MYIKINYPKYVFAEAMLRLAERIQSANNQQPYHPDRVSLSEVFRSMLTHPNSSYASTDNASNPTPPLPPFPLDLDISLNTTDVLMSPIKRTSTPEDNVAANPETRPPPASERMPEEESTVEVEVVPATASGNTSRQQTLSNAGVSNPTIVSLLQRLDAHFNRCGDILDRVTTNQETFTRGEHLFIICLFFALTTGIYIDSVICKKIRVLIGIGFLAYNYRFKLQLTYLLSSWLPSG